MLAGDVRLGDASGLAAAGHAGERDVVRLGHLARGRRRALLAVDAGGAAARAGAAAAARAPRGRRRGWRGGRRGRGSGAGLRRRAEQLADLDVLAFLPRDLHQHAGLLGADLEIDLLGLELHDRLAGGDGVAFLLQPARDARFDDRFTELGNDDVDATEYAPNPLWTRQRFTVPRRRTLAAR